MIAMTENGSTMTDFYTAFDLAWNAHNHQQGVVVFEGCMGQCRRPTLLPLLSLTDLE